jgi:hypothetical protein
VLRQYRNVAAILFGVHSVLILALAVVHYTRGVSDEDATFLLALLIWFLYRPAIWVLGPSPDPVGIFLAGTVQWLLIALPVAAMLQGVALWRGRPAVEKSVEDGPRR